MVNELSKQQRKVLIVLVVAILLGVGRLGFSAFSRGTVEIHLVKPVTVAWPETSLDEPGLKQGVLTLSASEAEVEEGAKMNQEADPPKGTVGEAPLAGRLDPNTATSEQLQTLPGIGPVIAARIIEYRETVSEFGVLDDLLAVKGIGEKTLAKIRPYLYIEE
jgi:competence protein ComEA